MIIDNNTNWDDDYIPTDSVFGALADNEFNSYDYKHGQFMSAALVLLYNGYKSCFATTFTRKKLALTMFSHLDKENIGKPEMYNYCLYIANMCLDNLCTFGLVDEEERGKFVSCVHSIDGYGDADDVVFNCVSTYVNKMGGLLVEDKEFYFGDFGTPDFIFDYSVLKKIYTIVNEYNAVDNGFAK